MKYLRHSIATVSICMQHVCFIKYLFIILFRVDVSLQVQGKFK